MSGSQVCANSVMMFTEVDNAANLTHLPPQSAYSKQQQLLHICLLHVTESKYERILLLARRILVMRIRIFKYNVYWLGVFGVL